MNGGVRRELVEGLIGAGPRNSPANEATEYRGVREPHRTSRVPQFRALSVGFAAVNDAQARVREPAIEIRRHRCGSFSPSLQGATSLRRQRLDPHEQLIPRPLTAGDRDAAGGDPERLRQQPADGLVRTPIHRRRGHVDQQPVVTLAREPRARRARLDPDGQQDCVGGFGEHQLETGRWCVPADYQAMRDTARPPMRIRSAPTWERLRNALPRGQTLSQAEWESRHKAMLWILWAHVVALPIFSLARGWSVSVACGSVLPIAIAGIAGSLKTVGRRPRPVAVAIGLLTASTVLVHAWNGRIEAHFHYFVMIAVLALYEDWVPFGLGVIYVVVEHGAVGLIAPGSVYDHRGNPWGWAVIHGAFVLAAAAAGVVTWRQNSPMRARMQDAHRRARDTD